MQTFLPEDTYEDSAASLDDKRLGKQRVEVLQLLNVITGKRAGWKNHPACKMWVEYRESLAWYGVLVCDEWLRRGFRDTCRGKIIALATLPMASIYPPWYNYDFMIAHRSNLIRKFPEFYRPKWPDVPDNLPYVWPVR